MEVVITYGYYDQNNFIKEFKHFTHHTPTQQHRLWAVNIHHKGQPSPTWEEEDDTTVCVTSAHASPIRWL